MANDPSDKSPWRLPTPEEILAFVQDSPTPVSRKELTRAFNIKGENRTDLRNLLADMEAQGLIERGRRRSIQVAGSLPAVSVVEATHLDEDGDLVGMPVPWKHEGKPPAIYIKPPHGKRSRKTSMGVGDRALCKLTREDSSTYTGRIIRKLDFQHGPVMILGIYHDGRLTPTERSQKHEIEIPEGHEMGAVNGELVVAEMLPSHKRLGLKQARVTDRLGHMNEPKAISLIAIHNFDIPMTFSDAALAEAETCQPVTIKGRTDMRDIPLVTIDGEDARDFDDAVWAEPDPHPNNQGGWHVVVAIADVSHYVRWNSALDKDARLRGNSVYFPDRVVPMLPERLSNGLCSLIPHENRACMAVHMWFDRNGNKINHQFVRGLMRSSARLTYKQVQMALDGTTDETTAPLLDSVIMPLYEAWRALFEARKRRGALEIDLPERQILFTEDGKVAGIHPRERYDAHRLIEDMMIAANVCAAETLEKSKVPCMYRIHEEPAEEKVMALAEFLDGVEIPFAKGQVIRPATFNAILNLAKEGDCEHLVNEVVLRSQMQAYYGSDNMGHFGLALPKYAHFTSPIRRYSDLMVHRALVRVLELGEDGLTEEAISDFSSIADHISKTERKAMLAERDAKDRYTTSYMAAHVGSEFQARITSVTRFGLFVELTDSGAQGLVPVSSLGREYFVLDEVHHTLTGEDSGLRYRLGEPVLVKLLEADVATGSLSLQIIEGGSKVAMIKRSSHRRNRHHSSRPGGGVGSASKKKKRTTPKHKRKQARSKGHS